MAGTVAVGAAGVLLAFVTSFALQRLVEVRGEEGISWLFPRVTAAAGVQAGWSALYGIGYLLIALVLVREPGEWGATSWARALCATALVLGVVLCLVVPVLFPLRALATARADELQRGRTTAPFVATAADLGRDLTPSPAQSYALDLIHRDQAYRWWVGTPRDGEPPDLSKRGAKMLRAVERCRGDAGPTQR